MGTEDLQRKSLKRRLLSCVAAIALIGNTMAPFSTAVAQESPTLTPIKHVIVIIGENRTFDHIFATYKPVNKGEKVLNLLSKGIVKADGTPGPNYGEALQYHAYDFKDTADLYAGIKSGQLPAVSYVKPSGWVDGHPASSKLNLFEGFVGFVKEI